MGELEGEPVPLIEGEVVEFGICKVRTSSCSNGRMASGKRLESFFQDLIEFLDLIDILGYYCESFFPGAMLQGFHRAAPDVI